MGFAFGEVGNEVAKSMASKTGWDVNGTPGHPGNDPASNNGIEFNGYPSGLRGEDGFFLIVVWRYIGGLPLRI